MTAPGVLTNPDMVREAALLAGVCARPVVARVTDIDTGETRVVPIACGTTRESKCPPCADKARRVRMHQCREGWHLTDEPDRVTGDPNDDEGQGDELADVDPDEDNGRRVRSTRRRQDVAELPRVPVEDRTVGQVLESPNGQTYRPSMFLTLTLSSYGRVRPDGTPVDPASYDYRRAALDALHFPKLVDRFWQNLRRCAGYKVQYFAAIEPQRRLAAHLHAAVRGVILPRVVRQVRAATYHQVWWPPHDTPVYVDRSPVWTDHAGYVDPGTGHALPTWGEALDAVDSDPDAEPAHVVRFGQQDDVKWLVAGGVRADRHIGYLCKYLTKAVTDTYDGDPAELSPARAAHVERLAEEARWLPCTPGCANWLRYGIQPHSARPGLTPGHCGRRAHDRENLGLGGRRVLVSRQWTGKTLAHHRADRAAVVRAALEEAGVDPDDHDELAIVGNDGQWSWEILGRNHIDDRTYAAAVAEAVRTRARWQREYETAKTLTGRAPPDTAAA